MAVRDCKECGYPVQPGTGRCPHCGVIHPRINYTKILWLIIGVAVFIAVINDGSNSDSGTDSASEPLTSNTVPSKKWYEGGNLHSVKVGEWRSSAYRNRLATSADFVIRMGDYQFIPSDLKKRAVELEACISEAVEGGIVDQLDVSEIGAACWLLIGYQDNDS